MYGVMHPSVFATLDSSPEIPARQLLSGQTPPLGQLPKPSMVGEAVRPLMEGGQTGLPGQNGQLAVIPKELVAISILHSSVAPCDRTNELGSACE